MTLAADEFLRRFLLHVLPKRLVRIRRFGFLAGPHRQANLARCRQLLPAPAAAENPQAALDLPGPPEEPEPPLCPHCGQGVLWLVDRLPRPSISDLVAATYWTEYFDTS